MKADSRRFTHFQHLVKSGSNAFVTLGVLYWYVYKVISYPAEHIGVEIYIRQGSLVL